MVDHGDRTLNIVLGSIFCFVCLAPPYAAVLLYRTRKKFNMAARGKFSPQAINATLWAMVLYCAVQAYLFDVETQECDASVGFPMIIQLGMSIYVTRFWVLIFRFRIAEKLAAIEASKRQPTLEALFTGPNSWFLRNRRLIGRKYLVSFVVVNTMVILGGGLAIVFMSGDLSCLEQTNGITALVALVVLYWTGVLLFLYRFTKKTDQDAFGIKRELGIVAFIGLFCVVVAVPIALTGSSAAVNLWVNLIIMMCCVFCWICSVFLPLRVALRLLEQQSPFTGVSDVASLADLLAMDIGYESFLSYAKKCFAQENVMFYKAHEIFRKLYQPAKALLNRDHCLRDGRLLIDNYIREHATFEVNLPFAVRLNLIEQFEQLATALSGSGSVTSQGASTLSSTSSSVSSGPPTAAGNTPLLGSAEPQGSDTTTTAAAVPQSTDATALAQSLQIVNLFERASKEVYTLMQTDVLPRYIQSEEWLRFVGQMKEINEKQHHSRTDKGDKGDKDASKHSDHSKHEQPKHQSKNSLVGANPNGSGDKGNNNANPPSPRTRGSSSRPSGDHAQMSSLLAPLARAIGGGSRRSSRQVDGSEIAAAGAVPGSSVPAGGHEETHDNSQHVVRVDLSLGIQSQEHRQLVALEDVIVDTSSRTVKAKTLADPNEGV